MSISDQLGRLGEDTVSLLFHRRIDGVSRFSARFLGEKAQFFDFIIDLLDADGTAYGPFFFVQVKTTNVITRSNQGIHAKFNAGAVRYAKARKVPVYLAAVMSINEDAEEAFIIGIDDRQLNGVTVVPRLFSLAEKETRRAIFSEVDIYFQSELTVFESKLTRKRSGRG